MSRIYLNGSDWKIKEFVGMDWIWRGSVKPETSDVRWWYPAQVPGSVMHDMMCAGKILDPYYELNSRMAEWVSERTWVYRKEFTVKEETVKGKHVELCFDGVDYDCEVFLNGKSLGKHSGMFVPFRIDISDRLLVNELNLVAVVVEAAPKEQPQVGRSSLVHTHKARMTYWWDFCPRMIHQGIWQDVYLDITESSRLEDCHLYAEFSADGTATVYLETEITGNTEALLRGRFGELYFETAIRNGHGKTVITVEQPRRWWVNGAGEAYEYEVELQLYEKRDGAEILSDERKLKYGLREIEFLQNEGTDRPAGCFTLCLNGQKIYMKGYNWVPADVMYGAVERERILHLVRLAKEAGVNIFRIWGGGLIETEFFYRTCAENGILIWQEFIQSSSGIENKTSEEDAYCALMEQQAEIIIKQKRNETALAIWCGGNELQDKKGMPLDNTDKLLNILKNQVEKWDKGRKWLPTSPSGGYFMNSLENIEKHPDELLDVHGPWEHQGMQEHCRLYNAGTSLMSSEFGVEGMANRWAQYQVMEEAHMLPADKENEIYFHRGAWWNNEPLVQEMFGGNLKDLEQIRKASQFMQYEGLKYSVECNLRRAMRNSGTFPWQFNEPYPNLFCTSVIDYYGFPKPAYYGIKKIYGRYAVSAAFESPSVEGKKRFEAEICAGGKAEENIQIHAYLFDMGGQMIKEMQWDVSGSTEGQKRVGSFTCGLDQISSTLLLLRIQAWENGMQVAENEYLFTKEKNFEEVYRLEEADITVTEENSSLVITNTGNVPLLFLYLTQEDDAKEGYLYFGDNYLCLMGGETRIIRTEGNCSRLAVQALNLAHQSVREE